MIIDPVKGARRHSAIALASATALVLWSTHAGAQQVTPPNGLPDRGVMRLQLGTVIKNGGLHSPRRFVHEPSGLSQEILKSGTCGMVLGGPNAFATLSAAGGNDELGLGSTSIGVYNGLTNVTCQRIQAIEGESVTFGLGPDLAANPVVDANAFWRLVLDVEVKQNAEVLLEVLADGAVTGEFLLRAGTSIVPGQGSTLPGSPDRIFNCTARTDGTQDLGSADNCRWQVDALGDGFRLTALRGETALEGGGDHVSPYDKNTLVYLTEGEVGALGCETPEVPQDNNTNTIGDGVNSAQCGVTRIDPTGLGGACTTAIGYAFRNIDGDAEGCEILKDIGEELAASVDIAFPPEPATALGEEPLTLIRFSDGAGNLVPFTPQRCTGTIVEDSNGNPTVLEVLSDPGFAPDVVPATPQKDWACVLESTAEYVGDGRMQVTQKILFWGDIEFSRR